MVMEVFLRQSATRRNNDHTAQGAELSSVMTKRSGLGGGRGEWEGGSRWRGYMYTYS